MIPIEIAILALQRLFKAFSGVDLPMEKARELIEQTKNEPTK